LIVNTPAVDPSTFRRIHLYTLGFFVGAAAIRIFLVKLSGVPISSYGVFFSLAAAPYLAMGAFLTFVRFSPRIAGMMNGIGLLFVGLAGSAALAVVVFRFGRNFPLVDRQLAAWDVMLGFDWIRWVQWFDAHPSIDAVAQLAYESIWYQPWLIVPYLAYRLQVRRLYAMMTAMVLALFLTCAIALVLPALGAYEFYRMSPADHPQIALITAAKMTEPLMWLRAAEFVDPMPTIYVGLISFPSVHSALAVIYAWATWRLPIWRWAFLLTNVVMLIATPVHGSHYFVDVFAGVAMAALALVCAAAAVRRLGMEGEIRRRPAAAQTASGAIAGAAG
jgi:PAP2 superfamily